MKVSSKTVPVLILLGVLGSAFILMLSAAKQDSAIMDELAHIPAGYSYVRFLDYRLNPEHPPLVKMLSGIPLLFQHLQFPTQSDAWNNDINGQWTVGSQFIYESGNNTDQLLLWARIGPILLTLFTILFIYFWAQQLIGRWWALLPTILFGLSPTILAHGHYVTTDIGATFGILIASYFFIRFLHTPITRNAVIAGIMLGIAQLMKFSAVLLLPYFGVLIAIIYWKQIIKIRNTTPDSIRSKKILPFTFRMGGFFLLTLAVALMSIYIVYAPLVIHYPQSKQTEDTQSILQSFGFRPAANLVISMTKHNLTRPLAQYALGVLMVTQRAAGGNTNYFLGEISAAGSRYYFPSVFVMKETLPTLILLASGLLLALINIFNNVRKGIRSARIHFLEYLEIHFTESAMLIFIFIYWGYSMKSPLNIGFRHIIPTLPFFYILASSSIRNWFSVTTVPYTTNLMEKLINKARLIFSMTFKFSMLGILLVWFLLEIYAARPYFLSYFNEVFGGTYGGYEYVTDSNFDWGQDLKRLKMWTDEHVGPNEKIAIDYFGGGSLSYYFSKQAEPWWSARGNPTESDIHWLAVSINTLQGAVAPAHLGFERNAIDEYRWLKNPYQPAAKAGTSIFIYNLK